MDISISLENIVLLLISLGLIYLWVKWYRTSDGLWDDLNGLITFPFAIFTVGFYLVWGGIFWW